MLAVEPGGSNATRKTTRMSRCCTKPRPVAWGRRIDWRAPRPRWGMESSKQATASWHARARACVQHVPAPACALSMPVAAHDARTTPTNPTRQTARRSPYSSINARLFSARNVVGLGLEPRRTSPSLRAWVRVLRVLLQSRRHRSRDASRRIVSAAAVLTEVARRRGRRRRRSLRCYPRCPRHPRRRRVGVEAAATRPL